MANAHTDITRNNLQLFKVPTSLGLVDGKSPIISDQKAAVQLGKALFWDENVGSKGVACASCHFHAGVDGRTHNQLNPGQLHSGSSTATTFDSKLSINGYANFELKADSFPLYQLADPDNINSQLLFQTDDVVGSAGIFSEKFISTSSLGSGEDVCSPAGDPIFHGDNNQQYRQTTKRNAPSVINAAFNRRNFWDGRANAEFNGVSVFGPRDPNAKIWVQVNGKTTAQKFSLSNASLASQAVGPAVDMIEMSCSGRTFKDIAKKLLNRQPLQNQEVHPEDSVLSGVRNISGIGLNTTYEALIKKAFNQKFWSEVKPLLTENAKTYSQMELNFSLFFGLAIKMYEDTLISDQAKWDKSLSELDSGRAPASFTDQEKQGLKIFEDSHCDLCHSGALFSSAVNPQIFDQNIDKNGNTFVQRIGFTPADNNIRVDNTVMDVGFFNTSVVKNEYDPGLGGLDPWGNPLSYTDQYIKKIVDPKYKYLDNFNVLSCNFTNPFVQDFNSSELVADKTATKNCYQGLSTYAKLPNAAISKKELSSSDQGRLSSLTVGAFKVPSLRNIELTGPYMHNGSMKSLEEVVDFYNRGGNFHNRRHPDTLVFDQRLSKEEKAALVAFLKTLTDERVRWEKAPFDHPAIKIANGHTTNSSFGLAEDNYLYIPAVGQSGLPVDKGPLKAFVELLK